MSSGNKQIGLNEHMKRNNAYPTGIQNRMLNQHFCISHVCSLICTKHIISYIIRQDLVEMMCVDGYIGYEAWYV